MSLLNLIKMPEPRDRLSRPKDISAMFNHRRRSIGGGIGIIADEEEIGVGTLFRWGDTAMAGTPGQMGVVAIRAGGGGGRVSLGTPRMGGNGRAQHLYRSLTAVVG
ncbi:unnamed protein product [Ilex paraguariensis]|uniref:Uncharacterized protein n=1 Tax=Ilex paraguariensis TaxID=185542 RepID=A0ABC8UKR3_9AQUA